MPVSFQDLRYFRAIADHRSLHAAGAAVGVSQPALSKCLKRLEGTYGGALVEWNGGRTELTEVGRLLLRKADEILYQVDEIGREIRGLSSGSASEVRFGAGPFAAAAACKQAVARFVSQHGTARVVLKIAPWDQLLSMLTREHLDFYVADTGDAVLNTGLDVTEISVGRLCWFSRAGHPLCGIKKAGPRELTAYPIAGPCLPARYRKWFMDVKRLGAGPGQIDTGSALSIECDDWAILKHVVENSDCISLSTPQAIRSERAESKLVILNADAPAPEIRMAIVRPKPAAISAAANRLIDLIVDEFESD